MAADIEMEALVSDGARDSSNVNGISFQDRDAHLIFRQKVGGGKARRSGSDNSYACFHFIKPPNFPG